jgi:murein DD-endopeptidase MepM/ murein hydrolase activator NlpD
MHPIAEGETLWDIARAYDVKVNDILVANQLKGDDVRRLSKGATIKIPGAPRLLDVETAADRAARVNTLPPPVNGIHHVLQPGESLWTLARLYDVPIDTIQEANQLTDETMTQLRVGQPLVVPGVDAAKVNKEPPVSARVRDGITHEVTRGETVWDVAHAFQVGVAEIMAANSMSEDDVTRLREGARLFIPGVEEDREHRPRRKTTGRQVQAANVARQLGLGTTLAAGQLLHGRVTPAWILAAGKSKSLPGTLRWPVAQGWFVRGYGSGEGGYHLAMDIAGNIGWNVRAAAAGIVGYSGDGIPGFGNLVLLIHPGGWVTLYAHNSVTYVSAGERVPAGAVIAEVGSTGISRGPHVHFELIYKGKNCDPAPLMRPAVRHRNGSRSAVKQATWTRADQRPREVQCSPRRRHPSHYAVIDEDPT